jgi:hypothetical protein
VGRRPETDDLPAGVDGSGDDFVKEGGSGGGGEYREAARAPPPAGGETAPGCGVLPAGAASSGGRRYRTRRQCSRKTGGYFPGEGVKPEVNCSERKKVKLLQNLRIHVSVKWT